MKKILFSAFIGLLVYWFIGLLSPSSVYAAPCPPLGTNIAANFDRENLEWLAQHANCDGPVPITVIITPAMVQNPDILKDVQNNLKELNFNPTWRPWGFVDPNNTQELNNWIDTFSLLEIGQLQAWNEWNRYKEAGTLDPARDAQVVRALINARNQGLIKIPIGNTPLDLLNYTDMNYRDYWTQFNVACPGCLNQLDFIVSNVYAPSQYGPNSVNEFLNVWQGELNFLRSLGVNLDNKFFIISEAGLAPGAYANFEERLRDTLLFAQALEAAILANPDMFPGLDQITFLLMNDDTGVIYLIYRECDDQGNCVWRVREYLEYNFNVPGSPFISIPSLQCTPESSGARDSRPDACDPCNMTSYFCPACATSFTVYDTVSYERWEGDPEEPHCIIEDWGGTVIIDPSSTTIPFVGKKEGENEQKYLADYFEGTNEYYQDYSQYWLDWVNHAGVHRKLTPMGYQDELKKEMVKRAKEQTSQLVPGGVHDYKVSYSGRLCWDLPFLADAFAAILKNLGIPIVSEAANLVASKSHYCVFAEDPLGLTPSAVETAINYFNGFLPSFLKISTWGHTTNESATLSQLNGNFPPNPNEENYLEKWRAWKASEGGKWFSLWSAVPMFSRNDTPGYINPLLGWKSKDSPKSIPSQIERVPHVARLFEETLELNELLLPQGTAGAPKFVQQQEESLLASIKENVLSQEAGVELYSSKTTTSVETERVLGEKTLLAQAQDGWDYCTPDGNACLSISIRSLCCHGGTGQMVVDFEGHGHIDGSVNGSPTLVNAAQGPGLVGYSFGCPSNPGDTACFNANVVSKEHHYSESAGCCCELDENGSCCCLGEQEPGEPDVCDIWGPLAVADCYEDAIKDTNPNDNLCCEPIGIELGAKDAFINKQYLPCGIDLYDCHTNQLGIEVCKDHCNDKITQEVNRRFGINLIHPYLNEIWNLSTNNETFGIFNIFRPAQIPPFEDLDASSEISYSYCREYVYVPLLNIYACLGQGQISPETGEFYFNHLGGVQKAKEWVTTKALMPYVEQ